MSFCIYNLGNTVLMCFKMAIMNRFKHVWILGLLTLFVWLAYRPALDNGFISWDDPGYVTQNPLIRDVSISNLRKIFSTEFNPNYHYHPLTILSFMAEYRLARLNPRVYHATNIGMHIANMVLVFGFVFVLTQSRFAAAATAGLFALHPMNVESVAWVTCRKNVLFAFFYLSALICYVGYLRGRSTRAPALDQYRSMAVQGVAAPDMLIPSEIVNQGNQHYTQTRTFGYNKGATDFSPLGSTDRKLYLLTFLFFILALLSKPAAVTLPLTLILLDFYTRNRVRAALAPKIPFFALSVLMGFATLQDAAIPFENTYPYFVNVTFIERLFLVNGAFWAYLGKFMWPVHLSCFYPYPEAMENGLPVFVYIGTAATLVFGGLLLRYFRNNRDLIFGLGFFVCAIGPNLPISSVSFTLMADRFMYVPMIGLIFVLVQLVRNFYLRRGPWHEHRRVGLCIAIGSVLFMFYMNTWQRCHIWRDDGVLWNDVIQKYPQRIPLAHYFRGNYFFKEGSLDAAIVDYDTAIHLMPHYFAALNNRGNAYFLKGGMDLALSDYNKALHYNPDYVFALFNRGVCYILRKEYANAIADFDHVLKLDSSSTVAREERLKAQHLMDARSE